MEATARTSCVNNILADFFTHRKDEVIKNMTIDMTLERRMELETKTAKEEGLFQGQELALDILTYITHNPYESNETIAEHFKCDSSYIERIRSAMNNINSST